jgi:hypothetical protein
LWPGYLPTLLDDALFKEGNDHATSIVTNQANYVVEVALLVEEKVADLDGMHALEV